MILWLLLQVLFKDFRFRATDASSNTHLFFLAEVLSFVLELARLILVLSGVLLGLLLFGSLAALSQSFIIMSVSI